MQTNIYKAIGTVLAAAALAGGFAARASEINYSAAQPLAERTDWGTGKAETYDVAILIPGNALQGSSVTGLSMELPSDVTLQDASGWISSRLVTDGSKFIPDTQSAPATWGGSKLTVSFATPEEVPEEGLYVGFSFTLPDIESDGDRQPLVLAAGDNENGLWLHTSRTYRAWVERSANLGKASVLTATLTGSFEAAAACVSPSDSFGTAGGTINVPLTLTTYGSEPVAGFTCTGTYTDGTQVEGSFTLERELPAYWGAQAQAMLTLQAPGECGEQMLTLEVSSVNGRRNTLEGAQGAAVMDVVAFVPVHRPLMEEYTGTWCGYCPKGFIALERMNHLYGDEFVGVSYHDANGHSADPMQAFQSFPNEVSSFPSGIFDRTYMMDPYYGPDYDHGFGIPAVWESLRATFTPADIVADMDWDGTENGTIEVNATVRFAKNYTDAQYRMAYIIVADGMTGPTDTKDPRYALWLQQNNYCDRDEFQGQGEDWDVFNNGRQKVAGLVFNDVAVAASPFKGVPGSLPARIEAGEEYSHSWSIEAADIKNLMGDNMLAEGMSLHCVAMVVDPTWHDVVVNCVRTSGTGYVSAVGSLASDGECAAVLWHDLTGARVAPGTKGLLLRTRIMADGSRHTDKTFVK